MSSKVAEGVRSVSQYQPTIGNDNNRPIDLQYDTTKSNSCQAKEEQNDDKYELHRRLVHIEPKHHHHQQQQQQQQSTVPPDLNIVVKEEKFDHREASASPRDNDEPSSKLAKPKIPRPANAFMLFANEWRKRLAVQNPRESNKDISVRLGALWKNMPKEAKERYFVLAREVDAEHKRKYPDYVYNPKEARLRKAMRDQTRSTAATTTTTAAAAAAAAAAANNNNSPASLGGGLLEQHQQRIPTSSLMVHGNGGSAINRSGPWFPALGQAASPPVSEHHHQQQVTKPAYSPKQRTSLEAKSKDGTRKQQQQQQDCTTNQGCYPGQAYVADYPVTQDASSAHQATPQTDYCSYNNASNLSSKWYPYQNGTNNAYHSRNTLMSKINGYQQQQQQQQQRSAQQVAAMRPLAHSAWGQFCNMPYQPNQSVLARANRHMFYLQEQYHHQQQQQHHQQQQLHQQQHRLDYADGAAQMQSAAFEAKMQDELARRLHATPPQEDSQSKNPLAQLQLSCGSIGDDDSSPKYSSSSSAGGGCATTLEEAPRWSTPRPSSVSSSSCTTDTLFEREELLAASRKPPSLRCKPLPGFQQAFGSTEIGKFSRSELFASLIEAAAATSTVSTSSTGDRSSSSPEMDDNNSSSAGGAGGGSGLQLQASLTSWQASPYAVGGEI